MRCLAPALLLATGCELFLDSNHKEDTAENCSNGIDDDGDGKIDCADEGCRALSVCQDGGVKSCGNGIVDSNETCDIAIPAGAAGACPVSCDDANFCTTDHLTGDGTCFAACWHAPVPNCCGNGIVESGESCDDGNQSNDDCCSDTCEFERALVTRSMHWVSGAEGCDLNGDGVIDNAFGTLANRATLDRLSNYFTGVLDTCNEAVVLWLLEGTDATMHQAPFQFAFVAGAAMPPDPATYFTGNDRFFVLPASLRDGGRPQGVVSGSTTMGSLQTEVGTLTYWLPCDGFAVLLIPLRLQQASLSGTIVSDTARPTLGNLRMCAAVTATSLHGVPNYSSIGGPTILDMIVVGINALGIYIQPGQPDIDVDGDGLEIFRDTDGDGVIDQCTDGNGAVIDGRDCPNDPRIADGYSMTVDLEAVGAFLAGRAP